MGKFCQPNIFIAEKYLFIASIPKPKIKQPGTLAILNVNFQGDSAFAFFVFV